MRACLLCGATYIPADYNADAPTWLCSICKATLPKVQTLNIEKEHMNETIQTPISSTGTNALYGIRGWLIIPAIGLILAPLKSAIMLVLGLLILKTVQPDLLSKSLLWFNGLIDIAMILATIIVAVLFFSRRRVAVKAIIALLTASIVANIFQLMINTILFNEILDASVKSVLHACVFAAIWIPYFIRSKRVKNTFVEE